MANTTNNPDGEWILRFGGTTVKLTGPLSDALLEAAAKAIEFKSVRIDDAAGGSSLFVGA